MLSRRSMFVSAAWTTLVAAAVLVWSAHPTAQQPKKGDLDDVEALVMQYSQLEDAGDMQTQIKLMAPDRWWHGVGGRRTDNALWMKVQGEQLAANQKRYPGVVFHREVRDLRSRLIAPTVAITSFTWFANRVIPSDLPAEKMQALGPAPVPTTVSMVWVKQPDGWKIVHTHNSPLYILPAR